MENFKLPTWLEGCPILEDWVTYYGVTYFASLNWKESVKRQKPVFDLAYCATQAMNEIWLKQVEYSKRLKLKVWNKENYPYINEIIDKIDFTKPGTMIIVKKSRACGPTESIQPIYYFDGNQ